VHEQIEVEMYERTERWMRQRVTGDEERAESNEQR
jgi:hypothetical protein